MNKKYIGFDPKKLDNTHCFLAEEILTPWVNHADTIRINMVNSHYGQSIVLDNPEFPKVYTGFEKQIGSYSSSYLKNDIKQTIYKNFQKHKDSSLINFYILLDKENKIVNSYETFSSLNITVTI